MAFRPIVITVSIDSSLPPFERRGEPVSIGVSCPRGAVQGADRWGLTDQHGRAVRVQTAILDRWGDGSVRWLLVEFDADVVAGAASHYALAPGDVEQPAGPSMTIESAGEVVRVSTGAATFEVPTSGTGFLAAARVGEASLIRSTAITAEDDRGLCYALVVRRATVERSGGLRAGIRLDGNFARPGGQNWLDATVRLNFFAGSGIVTADFAVTNPRAAVPSRRGMGSRRCGFGSDSRLVD